MSRSQKWFRSVFLAGLLAGLLNGLSVAQTGPAAPGPAGAQSAPVTPSPRPGQVERKPPVMRIVPTMLSANGGSLAHDVYTNSIYAFSLKTPPGWVVVPPQADSGVELSANPEVLKHVQSNQMLLLMTENLPLKKPYQRRSIQISATRMVNPQGQSAHSYLTYSQKTAKEKQMAVEYLNPPAPVTIKGHRLWWNKMKLNTAGGPQVASQYVVMQGPFLLQFFLVAPDEEGLKSLQPLIRSLDLKPLPPEPGTAPAGAAPRKKTAAPGAGAKPAAPAE